jgi:hypothetical protein
VDRDLPIVVSLTDEANFADRRRAISVRLGSRLIEDRYRGL